MSVVKELMAVLRSVPTPLVHIFAAAILATALTVIDTPAMVLDTVMVYNNNYYWVYAIQILMSVKRVPTCAVKCVTILLGPICAGAMVVIH